MRSPGSQPSAASAVVLTIEDWAGTFHVPAGAEARFEPGPRWMVPAAGALGLLLAALLIRPGPPSPFASLGVLLVVVGVAATGMELGGARGVTVAMAVTTVVWVATGAALLGGALPDERLLLGFLTLGILGEVIGAERLRRQAHAERDRVVAARRGTRIDGWVVRVDGPPWGRQLTVEASGGTEGPWTGSWTGWQTRRPAVGHPVGIWRGEDGRAVVLLPREPR